MTPSCSIRIGVVADIHGLFDPTIPKIFRGVDHIIHSGDIAKRSARAFQ